MTLDEMSIELLTKIGKAHLLTLTLIEAAERDIKPFPLEVSADAKTINQQAIAEIATAIQIRDGANAREEFLQSITSIFKENLSDKEKKRLAKNKVISETLKKKAAKRRSENATKKA